MAKNLMRFSSPINLRKGRGDMAASAKYIACLFGDYSKMKIKKRLVFSDKN
jgi:hypothetical protein